MSLSPKQPPGRRTRKARAFEGQIQALHAEGYSFEAIREALAEAGVHVSRSTVQREAGRLARTPAATSSATPRRPAPVPAEAVALLPVVIEQVSGKDIADAFVRQHINNPLLRRIAR